MRFTIDDIRKAQEKLQQDNRKTQKPRTLYFTREQIEVMSREGEKIDLENKMINGLPFEYFEPLA